MKHRKYAPCGSAIRGLIWTWRRAEEKYEASKYEVSGERIVVAHKDMF
jgi:hypothetical protein